MKIQLGGERDLFNSKMAGSNALLAACNSPIARNIINSRRFGKKKNSWTFELKEKIGNAKRIKISHSLWGRLWTAGWNGIWWKSSSSSFFRNESGRASCPVGLHNEMLTTDHTPSSRPKRRCPKCRIMTAGHSLSPSWTPTRNLLCPAKERETLCSSNNGVPHTTTTTLIHWTTYSRHRFFFVCLSPFVRTEEENKSDSLTKWWKGRRKKNFTFDSKWPDFWTRV